MTRGSQQLLWQTPLPVLACVAGSLVVVYAASGALGVTTSPSIVAALSAVLSAAAIAAELRGRERA